MNLQADAQKKKAEAERKRNLDKKNGEILKSAGKDFAFHLFIEGVFRGIFYVLWHVLTFFPKLLFRFFSNTP